MGYVGSFELNGVHIKTRATSDEQKIENHIRSFLHRSNSHRTKVIGLDAEWLLLHGTEPGTVTKSKCATLQLCDGHSCLIIHLNGFNCFESWAYDSVHKSLLNFLRLPNVTFVGVGIKENLAKLEKQYGFGCRNAVELGPFAASVMKRPHLSFCGVDELAFVVCKLDLRKYRPLKTAYDWGCLSKELAKLATVNVYSYYKIGSKLLQCDVAGGRNAANGSSQAVARKRNKNNKVVNGTSQTGARKKNKDKEKKVVSGNSQAGARKRKRKGNGEKD